MQPEEVKKFLAERNAFARENGVEIEEMAPGFGRCRMEIDARHLNPYGTAHAAAIFTLAETAFGAAALATGQVCVAANLSITYLKPGLPGTLTAEAREEASGGPLASFAVVVRNAAGEAIATATALGWRKKQGLEELL